MNLEKKAKALLKNSLYKNKKKQKLNLSLIPNFSFEKMNF
jgi:hypothetical protein